MGGQQVFGRRGGERCDPRLGFSNSDPWGVRSGVDRAIERAEWSEPVGGRNGFQEEKYGTKALLANERSRTAGRWVVVKGNIVYTPGVLRREKAKSEALSQWGKLINCS